MAIPVALRLVKLVRPTPGNDTVAAVRWLAARSMSRPVLNAMYSLLPANWKAQCHGRFSRIFYGYNGEFDEGRWRISVFGRSIVVPLRRQFAGLDWDAALSIIGHEPELKETYAAFVRLNHPPRLVLDIGANYGTHSIVFLRHGIQTISFEPNPVCHSFFGLLCKTNGIECRVEPLALGAVDAVVDLWYPPRAEWLGTTDPHVKDRLRGQLLKLAVAQTTVDTYVKSYRLKPDVLKIDTEGTELQVLEGAEQTLEHCRPLVLLESWKSVARGVLLSYLASVRYSICKLPLVAHVPPGTLTPEQFFAADMTNFAAVPRERLDDWPPKFA
jgi:FkbM family methyltransferase